MSSEAPAVRAAVDRALSKHRQDAVRDVEAILDAALRVTERAAPDPPRVVDIVAEAGTSNQTFYRYFTGKDELMVAIFERGLARLRTYLAHQMSKHGDPMDQVAAWVHGILRQATDTTAARQSAAVNRQLPGQRDREGPEASSSLTSLLLTPLAEIGSSSPELDAELLQEVAMGTLNRHLADATRPSRREVEHLVDFCLLGISKGSGISGS